MAGFFREVIHGCRSNQPSQRKFLDRLGWGAALADDELAIYDFLDELFANRSVSDPTYARAVAKLGERGVVDLTALTGYYTMIAMVVNVARALVESGKLPLQPFPQ